MEGERKRKIVSITLFAIVMVVELVVIRDTAARVPQEVLWFAGVAGSVIFGGFGVVIGAGGPPATIVSGIRHRLAQKSPEQK